MEHHGFHVGRRRLISFALIAMVIGSTLGGTLWSFGGVSFFKKGSLRRFSSYQELVSFLKKGPQDIPQSLYQWFLSLFPRQLTGVRFFALRGSKGVILGESQAYGGHAPEDYYALPEYSTTNIQVAGVDEADIVKTDGRYLYTVSGSKVYILFAYPPDDAEVLSKLVFNTTVAGIFVSDDKLVVFQEGPSTSGPEVLYRAYLPYYGVTNTSFLVYDISDRSKPILERNVTVDGYYLSSRMIGDYVYAIINEPAYVVNDSIVFLPAIHSGNITVKVKASSIYHTELPDTNDFFTNIVSINIQDPEEEPHIETFLLGATSCLYVSRENIYLTSPAYPKSGTNIHKISIEEGETKYVANGLVPGYVLNQFSMDEHKGLFRIATSNGRSNNVYVLKHVDDDLKVIGKLEDLAPGEDIYSARFMGNRCYLVTFRQVDPLFVIDLEDPEDPKVLGKLKIPGYSSYLHPYDEDHLIGVGKEVVDGREVGVKITLFDVSNVSAPKEVDKDVIGGGGWGDSDSPVLQDHKAFLFSRSKHLLVLPVSIYYVSIEGGVVQKEFWQGAYVYNLSIEEGFVLKGGITHIDDQTDPTRLWEYHVKRTLYIDQVLYTLSDKRVKMNRLEDLEGIGAVELP